MPGIENGCFRQCGSGPSSLLTFTGESCVLDHNINVRRKAGWHFGTDSDRWTDHLCRLCFRRNICPVGLPKVTGYIVAGIFLNPGLTHVVPESFVEGSALVTNIALAFITFSVGGTLSFRKIRSLGKSIIAITLLEAETAFVLVAVVFVFFGPVIVHPSESDLLTSYIPLAILLASLASPTDPSATLAVVHEYNADGPVTSTIMGVAAFDDILGMLNFSLAMSAAGLLHAHQSFEIYAVAKPVLRILFSIVIGGLFGLVLNMLVKLVKNESEGVLISLIISLLALCFGIAEALRSDPLLATMTMGVCVVNCNVQKDRIFKILERYTEELIFVLFFTLSAMHLDFSVLMANFPAILVFVLFRGIGKMGGSFLGGKISGASALVKKFTGGGLIPQGGIVIGLALVIRQNSDFASVSSIILNVIIGATIVHEIIGPVISKYSLKKAGEIQ